MDENAGSDGEAEGSSTEYVFYRDRPEWSDIIPIEQDDGPNPVVAIAYSDKFRDVYDYMRAVWRKDERSERAFHLTTDAIECNPANYTAWHFRRVLLQSLNKDLKEEKEFSANIVDQQPKNYQVWYHRQKVVEWSEDPSLELELTAQILRSDSKNYHAWQHRQWVVQTYNLWDGELDYIDKLLVEDFRNNSAWNQRYFIIYNTQGYTDDVIEKEVEYALGYIKKAPNNESPWNYLRGILKGKVMSKHPGLIDACEEMYSNSIKSPFLLNLLIDMYRERGSRTYLTKAIELCNQLSNTVDPIRKQYWDYIANKLTSQVEAASDS